VHYNLDGATLVTTPQGGTNVFSKGGGEALANNCNVQFLGSIPLDPSLMQSLEDGQAFIDLFPNSPTLNIVTSSNHNHFQTVTNGKQWRSMIEGTRTFFQKMVVEYVAFIQLDKCD